jgi:lanosterol synthase
MYGNYPKRKPIENAVRLIMSRQLPVRSAMNTSCTFTPTIVRQDGSWAQEAIEGIFNKTCAIAYPNFKFSFTVWALGKADKYLANLPA